jgi:hypothetical protein
VKWIEMAQDRTKWQISLGCQWTFAFHTCNKELIYQLHDSLMLKEILLYGVT